MTHSPERKLEIARGDLEAILAAHLHPQLHKEPHILGIPQAAEAVLRALDLSEAARPVGETGGDFVLVPRAALKWLNGEGVDWEGYWFGDHPGDQNPKGRFWWRSRFQKMLAAAPSPSSPKEDDIASRITLVKSSGSYSVGPTTYDMALWSLNHFDGSTSSYWGTREEAREYLFEHQRDVEKRAEAQGAAAPSPPAQDGERVRDILARLWCFAEGNNPDDTISDAGHTVLCGLLGGLDPKALAHIDAAVAQVVAHLTPPPQPAEVGEDDDTERCEACGKPLLAGQLVLPDHNNGGTYHRACLGPDRESFTDGEGNPLKPSDPIPEGYPYEPVSRSAEVGEDAWRPIESAPKDETWLLLCGHSSGYIKPIVGRFYMNRWTAWREYDGSIDMPTHWMPLPAPPASSGRPDWWRRAPTPPSEKAEGR